MIPNSIKVPVASEVVFPDGAMFLRIEAVMDFEARKQGHADTQARSPEGVRLWTVTVADLEQPAEGKFAVGSAEVKVKIAADVQPVIPSPQVPGFPPKVEFTGVSLTPWRDDRRCTGKGGNGPHRCGAKLAWSVSATGLVAFGQAA
jgi:hypothetical protein